jgi:hypothetical protein
MNSYVFFFGIPNFGIRIPISQFFNSGIREKFSDWNLRNRKRNQNSASNGGPRNRNQKSEFPTKSDYDNSYVPPCVLIPDKELDGLTNSHVKFNGVVHA